MGKIVLNTVYNVYMYEHVVIHVPCRQTTYISFIAFYLYFEYVGLLLHVLLFQLQSWTSGTAF